MAKWKAQDVLAWTGIVVLGVLSANIIQGQLAKTDFGKTLLGL